MARILCSYDSGAVSYAANTTKTILSLGAPTNQGVAWLRLVISAEGVAAADKPALVEWGLITGTGTGATEQLIAAPQINQTSAPTPQGVIETWSSEPTWSAVKGSIYCHLQSGYERVFQRGQDEVAYYGVKFGVRVTNPTGNSTTNIRATLEWEE
jgi:hypothetical protein